MEDMKKIASSFKHDQYVLHLEDILSEEAIKSCKKISWKMVIASVFTLFQSFLKTNAPFFS